MAAVVLSGLSQTVVATLSDGKKMVISDFVTDNGTTAGTHVISPLQTVTEWAFYVKDPADTPTTFEATITSGNHISIAAAADPTGCVLTVVSFGY